MKKDIKQLPVNEDVLAQRVPVNVYHGCDFSDYEDDSLREQLEFWIENLEGTSGNSILTEFVKKRVEEAQKQWLADHLRGVHYTPEPFQLKGIKDSTDRSTELLATKAEELKDCCKCPNCVNDPNSKYNQVLFSMGIELPTLL